ncbi:ADP-ribosylation factor-binding protein GGA [Octopus vulgaris]|uniref:ADP-ribosylation factor-binding protein GGA n=2 Tax=Octopus vulgaris TaxID=6645 RepID=A0AA36BZV5_OCTVU|nr:ADP-ribosylation factor-binding protein GGA [Octopus vulgaris]
MASEVETLDTLLNKATNPANREEDWDHMMMFCDRVNKDIEGPMISVRLLAHKLQSPQEREALFALLTLETCVKNCGSRFQSEIGKFRFLNEIIKVVSPKYLGTRTSENVKKRCIELMYSWTRDLSHEPKIGEAYAMLKTQGIVKEDPAYIDKNLNANPAPPPRPKNALFEDDEKARLLSRLLKSKNPEDLQAANRLIKNMVQQDADRIDKISKRVSELETINNNVSVLSEMLEHYGTESASQSDRDTMKELYETLEKLRPNLFRLASDTDEQDNDGIADILKANDEVMKVMNQYKLKVEGSSDFGTNHTLLDLGFDQTTQSPNKTKANLASTTTPVGASILDEQLLALGLSDPPDMKPVVASNQPSSNLDNSSSSTIDQLSDIFGSVNVEPSDKLSNVITASSTTDANPSPIHSVFNMGATNTPLHSGMAQAPVFPNFTATSQTPSLASGSFVSAPLKNKPQAFGSMSADALGMRLSSSTTVSESQKKAMEELDMLGKAMLMQSLSKEKGQSSSSTNSPFTSALSATGTNTTTNTTTTTAATSLSTTPATHSTNSAIGPFIGASTTTTTGSTSTTTTTTTTATATTNNTNNNTSSALDDTIGDLFCFNGDLTPSILTTASTTPASSIISTTTTTTKDAADILTATTAISNNTTTTTATTTINSNGSGGGGGGGDVVGSLLNFSTKPLVPVGQEPAYSDGGGGGGGGSNVINTGSPTLVPKEPISLSDVFVPLESVEPGATSSINAYEKDGLKIVIHFAKNKPRPDVLVLVVSVMNSGSIPIRNFLFQAAVPKEKIRLKYKITYYKESVQLSDVGEIDDFPTN